MYCLVWLLELELKLETETETGTGTDLNQEINPWSPIPINKNIPFNLVMQSLGL